MFCAVCKHITQLAATRLAHMEENERMHFARRIDEWKWYAFGWLGHTRARQRVGDKVTERGRGAECDGRRGVELSISPFLPPRSSLLTAARRQLGRRAVRIDRRVAEERA